MRLFVGRGLGPEKKTRHFRCPEPDIVLGSQYILLVIIPVLASRDQCWGGNSITNLDDIKNKIKVLGRFQDEVHPAGFFKILDTPNNVHTIDLA